MVLTVMNSNLYTQHAEPNEVQTKCDEEKQFSGLWKSCSSPLSDEDPDYIYKRESYTCYEPGSKYIPPKRFKRKITGTVPSIDDEPSKLLDLLL